MINQETMEQFIQLRGQGVPFRQIASQLNVGLTTLVRWSQTHRHTIHNLQAIEREEVLTRTVASRQQRLQQLAARLSRLETELNTRELSAIPTSLCGVSKVYPFCAQTVAGMYPLFRSNIGVEVMGMERFRGELAIGAFPPLRSFPRVPKAAWHFVSRRAPRRCVYSASWFTGSNPSSHAAFEQGCLSFAFDSGLAG
jgi:hypothetical protein